MKTLFRYLKSYSLYCFLGPLFKLIEVIFELYVPLVLRDLIEEGISLGDQSFTVKCVIKIALLGLMGFLSALSAQFFAARASAHATGDLKKDLFSHIQQLSFSQIGVIGKNTLFSRLTVDMNQIQTGVNLGLRLLLRSPFVVFGAMIMAFFVNKRSAVYFVILIPLMFLFTFFVLLKTIPMISRNQKLLDKVITVTRENLTGTRVIRAFRHEDEEVRQFTDLTENQSSLQLATAKLSLLLNPVTTILVNVFTVLLISNGKVQFDNRVLSQADLLALYNYMSMILVELIKLANLIITLTRSIASANRIQEIMNTVPEDIPRVLSSASVFHAENSIFIDRASFCYPSASVPAISNLSFSSRPGETIGIIGGIGSGKTTLGYLIAGYYLPTDGTISLYGKCTSSTDPKELRQNIGFVFQHAKLVSGTVRTNLQWSVPNATDVQMIEALKTAQAWDYLETKQGLDTVIERDGRNLSGGQRQRLSIARALLLKPRILIFDDSASALDYITEAKLRKALACLSWKPTKVIISQRISSIQHADKILVLDRGHLAGIGTHEQLLSNCPEYIGIAQSQGMEAES